MFSASGAPSQGLELLASAGFSINPLANCPLTERPQSSSPLGLSTYNPAASLPAKLVKHILDLDFVEMSELVTPLSNPARPLHHHPP